MIASGYSMDLYCDYPDGGWRHQSIGRDQYTGETFAECKRQAVAKGWKFDMKTRRVLCPNCKALGRKLPATQEKP